MKTSDLKKTLDQRVSSTEWTTDNTWNVLNRVRKEKAAPKHSRIPAVLCAAAALLIVFAGILASTGRLGLTGRPDHVQGTPELIPLAQHVITPETELYYIPEIGEYYHLDPNCRAVSIQHKPMQAHFTWAEINSEAYRGLQSCSACGAPLRPALPVETAAPAGTETPETEAPATEAPETEVPVTEAPETEIPVTEIPATEAPAAQSVYTYTKTSDSTVRITGADENIKNADIPAELDGYTVTAIGADAFENCWNLNEVTLPDTVTKIEQYAFAYSGLQSINIPDSVTTIENGAFTEAFHVSSIRISDSHPYFAVRNNALIRKSDMALLKYIGQEKGPYEIEKGITTISKSAFDNGSITAVVIPDSVTAIEDHAFSYTEDLKEVTIPDSVTFFGTQVFFRSGITALKIPAGLTDFGDGCFDWCLNLKSVEVDPANPVYEMRDNLLVGKKDKTLLYYLDNGKDTLEIPEGIEAIQDSAFTGNKTLKEIIIPDTVKTIHRAFFECTALKNIRLPEGMKVIETLAFAHCRLLKSITVPESVKSIHSDAFYDCVTLAEVIIPGSATSIDKDAFKDCSKTLTVKAPAGSPAQKFCETYNIRFEALD